MWSALVVLTTALGVGAPLRAQARAELGRITGRIVDQESGESLRSATLEVLETDIRGPAGPDGRFMLPPMAPGIILLRIVHPGFEPRTEEIEVFADRVVDVRIGLVANATYTLDPVLVSVRSRVLESRGFYERQSQGYSGIFLTREDIEERDPRNVTELFDGLPGTRVMPGDLDGPQVVFTRAISLRDSGMCRPALFLDGVKSQIRLYDMILDPSHIEGIEVYVGAGVPGRFNDPCGAILFWTR